MKNLQTIYNTLWEKSIKKYEDNKFELDYYLNNKDEDNRRGISLIARIESKVETKIIDFLNECESIEPNQHYYNKDDIHTTILSIITCFDGFTMKGMDTKAYAEVIEKSIKGIEPFEISFKGITASPSCVMIQGFPTDNRLELLRQNLRDNFGNSTLKSSMDRRYKLQTAHSTVIRFKDPIINNNQLIDCLNKYRSYDFGTSKIDSVQFVYNDWYMDKSIVSKIKTFDL